MRYLSLDFFRGLTIALMVVVNNAGNWQHVFAPLRHAEWHGCTPTDLVFPFFLFIVGVSMWFSFSKMSHLSTAEKTYSVLRRMGLIFLVGLLLNAYPFIDRDWYTFRFMGVLQRIALAYGLAGLLCIWLSRRNLAISGGVLLLGYWLLLWLGGTGDPYSLQGNLVRQLDLAILTPEHLYKGFGIPFDPEGLLSTLPAVVNVICGYFVGIFIHEKGEQKTELVTELAKFGLMGVVAGFLWGNFFPINKPLWTSSYALYTIGWAMLFLSLSIWALDIRGWRAVAKPFLVFGANPLFAFVLSGILAKTLGFWKYQDMDGQTRSAAHWIYQYIFYPIEQYELGSLLYALSFGAVIWLACWLLYRRRVFIKI
jgi:predicted acyltransferase